MTTGTSDLPQDPEDQATRLLALCKVLLDEYRLALLGSLAVQGATLKALASLTPLSEKSTLKHLHLLKQAGLVGTWEGDETVYYLDVPALHRLKQQLFASAAPPTAVAEDELVGRFLRDGRLVQIPVRPAGLQAVLAWLAANFEPGVQYPEREVNQILQQYHPDHATLRRMLVDHQYLDRASGLYWRR
jgi:hypothetical protein